MKKKQVLGVMEKILSFHQSRHDELRIKIDEVIECASCTYTASCVGPGANSLKSVRANLSKGFSSFQY